VTQSRGQPWSTIHTDAAVVFIAVAAVHVLAYLPAAWRTAGAARRPRADRVAAAGPARRRAGWRATLVAALAVGLVLAVATIPASQLPNRGAGHRQDAAQGGGAGPRP
jgi:hypothetical protein